MPPAEADPDAARVLTKVRRLMVISLAFTGLAIAAVLSVIGYRVFSGEGSRAAPADVSAKLPRGARVVATNIANDRLVLTIEVETRTELHLFDVQTLQPRGRLRLSVEP